MSLLKAEKRLRELEQENAELRAALDFKRQEISLLAVRYVNEVDELTAQHNAEIAALKGVS